MSALAAQHKAVNLGQGFPDFPMNADLIDLVAKAMRENHNQYAPMPGWMPLREAIAEKIKFLYGTTIDPDASITITPGGTYAIYSALTAVLHPGDEVILFEPAYDSYIPNIEVNGGIAVRLPLVYPDYRIDWEAVRAAITPRTKVIFINSPHNPTGAVLGPSDIEELRKIVASVAPPSLMKEFRKIHQFNAFSCFTPTQVALAEFLKNKEAYLSLGAFMQERRDYFIELMQPTRFELLTSHGSYFICARYNQISEEGDLAFATRLTKEAGVTTIPVSAFYADGKDDHVIRFCFAKKKETLEQAVERLLRY